MPSSGSIGELVLKFTADVADILTNTEKVKQQVGSLATSVTTSINDIRSTIRQLEAAFAVFESVKFLGNIVTESIAAQASLSQLADKTGITVEQLSALSNTAAVVGVNLEESSNLLFRFEKNINDAASGTGKAADALRSLGFNAKDLAGFLRDPNEALLTIAGRLGDFRDGVGKTTAELDLFGRAGAQLAPLLKLIADQGLSASTVTAEMAAKAEALTRQWNTLKNDGQQLINQVIAQWVPTFIALLTAFKDVTTAVLGLKTGAGDLIADGSFAAWAQRTGGLIANFTDRTLDLVTSIKAMGAELKATGVIFGDFVYVLDIFGNFLAGNYAEVTKLAKAVPNFSADWKNFANQVAGAGQQFEASHVAIDAFTAAVIRGATPLDQYAQEVGQKAPLAVTKFTESLGKLRSAIDEYEKSLATVAKAGAQSILVVQQEQGKIALSVAKRQYEEGLISFKEYYDQQTAIAAKGYADQQVALNAEIAAQETLVKSYQATFDSLAIGNNGIKNNVDLLAAQYKAQTLENNALAALTALRAKANVVTLQAAEVGKDVIEVYTKENSLLFDSVAALNKKIEAAQLDNATIGLTASQIQLVIAARAEEKIQIDLASGAITSAMVPALQAEIDKRQQLAAEIAKGEDTKNTISAWQDVLKETDTVLTNILNHSKNTWEQITQYLKDTLVKYLVQLTTRQFIIPIIAQINPQIGAILGQQAGTSLAQNPFSLFTGGGGGLGEAAGTLFGTGEGSALAGGAASFTDALGVSGAEMTAAFGGATEGAALLEGGLAAAGTAIASFIPVLGAAFIAYEILSNTVFKHEPSPAEGQFGIKPAGTDVGTFEDQSSITTKFGNLMIGFLDQGTQQFSGKAALVFDKVVGDSIDAFATRFSPEQSAQFAEVLKNMTFAAFSGTFTTEDFLQKYGGQILQQVIGAAFDILDPALGTVIEGFKGTADEVAKFSNTLLGVYDASKNFSSDFQATIAGAFGDVATQTPAELQATADKILAFVEIVKAAGTTSSAAFNTLGQHLQGLSSEDIPKFIDALGGAKAAFDGFTFLYTNFTTSAQKTTDAIASLNTAFTNLGITEIPQTHAAFLALLNSFDLTTDAGRQLYASVLALAPAFVQVHGTADDATRSLTDASTAVQSFADTVHNLSGTALQSAQDFFNTNFLSADEQQTNRLVADHQRLRQEMSTFGDQIHALGYTTIPTTTQGFHDLVLAATAAYGADSDFAKSLLLLAPTIKDIGNIATTAANQISAAAATIANTGAGAGEIQNAASKFVSKFLSEIDAINQQNTGDFGAKLGFKSGLITGEIDKLQAAMDAYAATTGGIIDSTIVQYQEEIGALQQTNTAIAHDLAQFTILKASYGSSIAEQLVALQDWYDQQKQILKGNSDALTALTGVFDDKWKAIITGTSTGVNGTTDALAKLIQSIRDFIKQLTISDISPLTPLQKLAEAQKQYNDELALAQSGNQTAIGDISKFAQAYLTQARAVDASSQAYTDIFNAVVGSLNDLANANTPTTTGTGPGTVVTPPPILPPGYGSYVPPDRTGRGGPSSSDTLALLAGAVPASGKLASTTDMVLLGSKLDRLNTDLVDIRATMVAANNAADQRSVKHVSAVDRSAQTIVTNLPRKGK